MSHSRNDRHGNVLRILQASVVRHDADHICSRRAEGRPDEKSPVRGEGWRHPPWSPRRVALVVVVHLELLGIERDVSSATVDKPRNSEPVRAAVTQRGSAAPGCCLRLGNPVVARERDQRKRLTYLDRSLQIALDPDGWCFVTFRSVGIVSTVVSEGDVRFEYIFWLERGVRSLGLAPRHERPNKLPH